MNESRGWGKLSLLSTFWLLLYNKIYLFWINYSFKKNIHFIYGEQCITSKNNSDLGVREKYWSFNADRNSWLAGGDEQLESITWWFQIFGLLGDPDKLVTSLTWLYAYFDRSLGLTLFGRFGNKNSLMIHYWYREIMGVVMPLIPLEYGITQYSNSSI